MKIYFVRHGETDMNARNMFYGWYDADINEKGISQAEDLRDAFRDIPIDAIYSSDLTRAYHTAEIIAEGRPIEKVFELREMAYGIWENRTWESMTEADRELLKQWRYDWLNLRMPEGEAFMDFYNRVVGGLEKIIKENKGNHVLVVSHNGALSVMHCHLTGAGPKGFWNFNSKQGHYSAVWVSENKLTYDCFNYPAVWKKESTVKVYFDCEQDRKIPEDKNIILTGKAFDPFVMTCEENGFTALQRKRNINLIWEGNIPKLDLYPVPKMTLFAHDGNGGYFAHAGKNLESPVYFISNDLECWYLADNFRTFVQMVVFEPNWKEKITGESVENHETMEELKAFGMQFGIEMIENSLSDCIRKESGFRIFENIEKAREKVSVI